MIAPWREWDLNSRTALIEFARKHDIPVPVTAERPYSTDRNLSPHLLRRRHPGRPVGRAAAEDVSSDEFAGVGPRRAGLRRDRLRSAATRWPWTARSSGPCRVLETVNRLGGEHGIGRVDLVENRYVGMKSRGVYETPGGTILHAGPPRPRVADAGPRSCCTCAIPWCRAMPR